MCFLCSGCWIYNDWDLCYNLFCCNIYCDTCISCALCETDLNSSYAVPIRPRFIRNTEIDANGHGKEVRRQNNFGLTRNEDVK